MLYVLLSILMSLSSINIEQSQSTVEFEKSTKEVNHSNVYLTVEQTMDGF